MVAVKLFSLYIKKKSYFALSLFTKKKLDFISKRDISFKRNKIVIFVRFNHSKVVVYNYALIAKEQII